MAFYIPESIHSHNQYCRIKYCIGVCITFGISFGNVRFLNNTLPKSIVSFSVQNESKGFYLLSDDVQAVITEKELKRIDTAKSTMLLNIKKKSVGVLEDTC